jgi:hypothetical protein
MKALNRKQRRTAQWAVVLFFFPMMGMVVLGSSIHFKVMNMQVGDLEEKEQQYDDMFRVQAKKGEAIDGIITGLEGLKDPGKTFSEHQNAQQIINKMIADMLEIRSVVPDTSQSGIHAFPAIYDSLVTDIRLIQSTRDSIKTVDEVNKNFKFQLHQCRESLKERLAEQKKKNR